MNGEEYLGEIKLAIKRGPIDSKARELLFHPDFMSFEAGEGDNPDIKIDKGSVREYRYGLRWISGYKFTIGREYQVFIKHRDDQVLKIHFKSFYGIRKIDCHNTYSNILDNLWNYYFRDIANEFIQAFWNDQEFSIGCVTFCNDGLKIKRDGIFNSDVLEIPWNKVRTKDYQTYFVIYSADNPAKENKSFSYLDDWNTDILQSVTRTIVKNIDKN